LDELSNELTILTKQNKWLKEVSKQAIGHSLQNLGKSFQNFFENKSKFPKFKTRRSKQSFYCGESIKCNYTLNKIQLPKFRYEKINKKDNRIKCIFDRRSIGIIKSATVCKTTSGKYFVSILVNDFKEIPKKQPINKAVGLDFGLKTFITTSDGDKINNPEFYKQSEKR